jgi:hypothetical protein
VNICTAADFQNPVLIDGRVIDFAFDRLGPLKLDDGIVVANADAILAGDAFRLVDDRLAALHLDGERGAYKHAIDATRAFLRNDFRAVIDLNHSALQPEAFALISCFGKRGPERANLQRPGLDNFRPDSIPSFAARRG